MTTDERTDFDAGEYWRKEAELRSDRVIELARELAEARQEIERITAESDRLWEWYFSAPIPAADQL